MDLLLLIIINVSSILWNKYTWSNLFFELCSRLCVKPKWRPRGPWSHSFGTYYVMKLSHLGILEKKTSPLKTKCSEPLQIPRNKWADGWNTTLNSICLRDLLPTLPLIDPPSRGQAWHWTHHWRALQSRRRSLKQQSSWKLSNEVIKSGKCALLEPLHELLSLCWEDGAVSQDMRAPPSPRSTRTKVTVWTATNIVAALSWARIVSKVIARVLLSRLQAPGRTESILCPSLASERRLPPRTWL